MKISKQARRDAKSLFSTCRQDGILSDSRVRTAVTEVLARKPRGYVGVLHHFHRLVKLDLARRTAKVESAAVLPGTTEAAIRDNLGRRYGQGLQVDFSTNPALLGGIRVQVGSDVYDGSVAARLTSLQDSF